MESPAKKKILDALAEATRHFAWNDLSDLSAQSLADTSDSAAILFHNISMKRTTRDW